MFFWTTNKATRNRQAQRTFRPGADVLEAREVPSTLPTMPVNLARSFPFANTSTGLNLARPFPFTNVNSGLNLATVGMQTPGLQSVQNLVRNGSTGAVFSAPTTSLNLFSNASNFFNQALATTQTATSPLATRVSVPTQGLTTGARSLNGINPNFLLNAIRQGTQTGFTGTNNPALFNSTGVSSGLAFTNGLGFTNNTSRFTNNNGATNGLAFTNGLGFSTPSFGNNAAQTGLAFTNGAGFTTPAGRVGTNAASTGLAFTNGQGGTLPAAFSPFFNSTNNGLTFTNGLGFTNPNNNPFLRGTTSIASNILSTNTGLGSGSITIGGPSGFTVSQPTMF